MANKYCNLIGTNKIKDEYPKINTGFDKVETDVNAVNGRVDNIVNNPDPNKDLEIVDARHSAVKDKTFTTLDARLEETENDVLSHMADIVSETLEVIRDISLVGTQTITTQKKAKSVSALAAIQGGGISRSIGFWSENGVQRCVALYGSNQTSIAAEVVRIGESSENRTRALISNVKNNSFDITWTKDGSPTGTVALILQIEYHGE